MTIARRPIASIEQVDGLAPGRDIYSGYGFNLIGTDVAYFFLAYEPGGDMLARIVRSAGGRTIGRSADGRTWVSAGTPSAVNSVTSMWFSAVGTWFAHVSGVGLYRSADEGANWALVAETGGLLEQGFAEESDGTLWCAEYMGDARIFKSVDDGVTWSVVYDFPNTDNGDGTTIRHVHGIGAFTSGVWVYTGDNDTQVGFWKWDGSEFIRQSPSLSNAQGAQRWRTVSVTERDGWFYWVQDGASIAGAQPAIVKANPSDLAGTLTILATVPSGGWYTASLPSGEIVIGSVIEAGGLEKDESARLWLVDNQDAVHEVWSSLRVAGAAVDYTAVRGLRVHPTTGEIAFTVNQTDWTGSGTSAYGTVRGVIEAGSRPLHMARSTAPRAYTSGVKAYVAAGTTSSPTTASSTFEDVPEMAITVVASTRPWLVSLAMDARINTAGQYLNVRLVAVEAATGALLDIHQDKYGATTYGPMAMSVLWVPPYAGSFVIKAQWSRSGSAVGESQYLYRHLTVVEI